MPIRIKSRPPAVAGAFYEGTPESLRRQIEECFLHPLGPGALPKVNREGPRRIIGLICPHAGYMYSGPVAAHAYHALASDGVPDVVVVLGPNHYGIGSPLAIMNQGHWETPLGEVSIDEDVANAIVEYSGIIEVDDVAHMREHSIEVQLPFLQYLYGDSFRFVPITMLMQDLESSRIVGRAIAKAIEDLNAVIIASTDFTHYEPQENAERKDQEAIKRILALDPEGLVSVVNNLAISMCGVGPVIAMLTACKELGATTCVLLKYATSGDVTGDYTSVVGYGALSVLK
ncbi:MAG: hypothetical protein DRN15_03560 [Thermoprotei archaeon]|nr:MAG: hypothetical protein DRN15_03560 [Thermoprotei archaeon]RLF24284.1 MAG: hypothetical protein DRM97_03720 [Thermoprotei archaeon]